MHYEHMYCISLRPTPFYRVQLHSAHPYLTHLMSRPIRLHHTLYSLFITTVTLNIIYITFYTPYPWPSPCHRVHTIHSAHSYIMLQLLPSPPVGWPLPQATLSPSAGRLRRVSSLNGLILRCAGCLGCFSLVYPLSQRASLFLCKLLDPSL